MVKGGRHMTFREIDRILRIDGWTFKTAKGSHHHYIHHTKPGKVTVPYRLGDIAMPTAKAILKQAGIKEA
jgi:predicted RNA binding protein YcfA (HicA-like mRNA interferase family)